MGGEPHRLPSHRMTYKNCIPYGLAPYPPHALCSLHEVERFNPRKENMFTVQLPNVGSQFVLDTDYEAEVDGTTVQIEAGTVFTIEEIDGRLTFAEHFEEYGTVAFGATAGDVTFYSPDDRSGQSDRTLPSGMLWFDIDPEELELI
ncbi:Hypothetical Protein OBI_RACECAR_44 [Arthrobacter phage Racecar]|nr:hypothetical protein PBI_RACECAR_125 [Arthrobacter phage Racecar]QFG12800.1 hypothetical protein PBI_MIMI_122 [Arthrobacter phage Mimi]